jgi:hypothetical protein
MKIEAQWKDYTETYQGVALYKVVAADADRIELKFWGGLKASIDAKGRPASPPLPIEPGFGQGTITIDRRGNWIDSYSLTPLPYVLGDLEFQVFEQFPDQTQANWQFVNDISVEESRGSLRHRSFGGGPQRGGSEQIVYSLGDAREDSVRVAKKYALSTTVGELSSAAEVNLTGNGQFTFDVKRGLNESLTMNYEFKTNEQGRSESANVAVTYQLLSADRLAAELKPRLAADRESDELSRQAYEDATYPQFRGLSGPERMIAKLGLSDTDAISETLGELAQTPTDERLPEVAKAIARHLQSSDVTIQQYAAQALIHWGTRDVEAELVEATKSREYWVAKYAKDALDKIRGQSTLSARSSPAGDAIPTVTAPVNLLANVNPQRDQVQGSWTMQGGNLISPQGQADTLVIPLEVPTRYTLTVVAERITGNDSLSIGLIVGGRQTMLALEGWGAKASGLNTIDGRTADNNETTFHSPVFTAGAPTTIVCLVRESSVQVLCNGDSVVNWTGDPRQLDLDRRFWTRLPEDRLFLGTWLTTFRITKLELAPLAE